MSEPASVIWSRGDYHKIAAEHQIVSETLCSDLAIGTGHTVLDVACGTGNTAIAAARRRATVTGCDITPALLERARVREAAEGVGPIEWMLGDAATLPFDDETFDVTVSTFGAVFVVDQVRAASELLRVTKPGGTVSLTSYTPASVASDVYWVGAEFLPPPTGLRPAFEWASGRRAEELLGDGRASVTVTPLSYTACYASPRAYVDHYLTYYGPMISRVQSMSNDQAALYEKKVEEAVEMHNVATDGTLMATFDYVRITAVKPPSR
ncbi:MAG: class I SAM-dependent methyltransferase [Rhodococcus sp. (in: high G+C Gram-positive bacteria)]